MSAFIDEHRARFGVEPICRILGVSASAYYERATGRVSTRRAEDARLLGNGSSNCTPPTTAPMGIARPGWLCVVAVRRSAVTGSSG